MERLPLYPIILGYDAVRFRFPCSSSIGIFISPAEVEAIADSGKIPLIGLFIRNKFSFCCVIFENCEATTPGSKNKMAIKENPRKKAIVGFACFFDLSIIVSYRFILILFISLMGLVSINLSVIKNSENLRRLERDLLIVVAGVLAFLRESIYFLTVFSLNKLKSRKELNLPF